MEFRELWPLVHEYVHLYLNSCRICGAGITHKIYHMWQNHTHIHVRIECDKPEDEAHSEWVQIPYTELYNLVIGYNGGVELHARI